MLDRYSKQRCCYKGLPSGTLTLRCYNGQVGEALANVKVLNKVIGLGIPKRQVIG